MISVLGDESAAHLARAFSRLEPGRWAVKSEQADRFQLAENWLFERSEASRVVNLSHTNAAYHSEDQEYSGTFLKGNNPSEALFPQEDNVNQGGSSVSAGPRPPPPPRHLSEAPPRPGGDSGGHGEQGVLGENEKLASWVPMGLLKQEKSAFPGDDDATNPEAKISSEFVCLTSEAEQGVPVQLPISKKDKRRFARVSGRLRVVLISGRRSFRTHTVNISKGGILLEHRIPIRLIGEVCKVVIGSPDMRENLEFQARVVGGGERPAALEFIDSKAEFLVKLDAWLLKLKSSLKAA